ncbi:MAG: hypothetical protein BWZ03_00792 [bacterium ADurb.BinA186]|nr:MAG: hypothetical protein BWZ03_00792 [bacterium ADurb.BinA186]
MKKTMIMVVGAIGLILISCGLAQKSSQRAAERKTEDAKPVENTVHNSSNEHSDLEDKNEPDTPPQDNNNEPQPIHPPEAPDKPNDKPITQFDSEKLDARVREMAALLKEDVKTFRLLIRTEDDGTKIYRMIGMHVIVNPQGDEVFLPDEI